MTGSRAETTTDRYGVEAPARLDGVDLTGGCPSCGYDEAPAYEEMPAGYYTCVACYSTWAGYFEDATLVKYLKPEGRADV